MSEGIKIVNEFNSFFESANYAWNPYYPQADQDLRYYLGDQWSEADKQALYAEGRKEAVFNLCRKNINLVDGYQRQHRLSSVVIPQEPKDQKAADQLSNLVQYVFQAGDGYRYISDAFSGAIKTGWNLCNIWMDYRDDPLDGDIRFSNTPHSGFITDPYFTQLSLDDCSYVIKRKYMSPEQCASLLPDFEEEIWNIHSSGWSRDDKFSWLPYQMQPNGQDFMAYNEFTKQSWRQEPCLVDTKTGEYTDWKGPKDALRYLLSKHPQLKLIKRPKKYIENHIIVNNVYMKTEVNQFGLDEYPFVPFVGVFEPANEFWNLKLQSLTRCCVSPQNILNQRLVQMNDIVESQINSGWIAEEDSVVNPNSLFQSSQGRVIWKKKGGQPGNLERIRSASVDPAFFQLTDIYAKGLSEIMGVNDAAFGVPESGNESGVMMMLRQGAAITNLQSVFDNLRFSQKELTRKALKLIQTWSPAKIERILGEKPTEQFYSKDFIKYDINIAEGLLTDNQRQQYFRQLVDLKQLGAPVTGSMLAQAAPIQGKSEYLEQLQQAEQQEQQQAQKAQQVQEQILASQMELNKSSAIQNLAGAKERFTRAFANVGLSDERAAKAVDDRANAALDRAKAIRELSMLDDEQLIKYLQIVRIMEKSAESDEERIKSDDLAVAAQGQELGDQQVSNGMGQAPQSLDQLLGQGAQAQQQTNEVPNGQLRQI